jgi:hypothetical protein
MRTLGLRGLGAVFFTALVFVACGGGGGGSGGSGDVPTGLDVTPSLSECGGFLGGGTGTTIPPPPDKATYCEAERILWNYDAATKTLGFLNARMMLNCCGIHTISAEFDGGTYVIRENDAPEMTPSGPARCGCMCVFDYAADVSPVEGGVIKLEVHRHVTDQEPALTMPWQGTIDLAAGSGELIVSTESAEPWCTSNLPP